MISEGKYRGRPVRAALGLAGTGTEQIAVQFEFVEPAGERLTWYGFFTPDTEARTLEALRHCGWRGDDLSVFVEGQPPPEGFDQEVELVVKHEVYQGKTNARIAFVNGGGGLALKNALTSDQAAAFAKRMRSRIVALDKAASRAPASNGGAAPRPPARPPPARPAPRAVAPAKPAEEPQSAQLGPDDPPLEHIDARAEEELGAEDGGRPF